MNPHRLAQNSSYCNIPNQLDTFLEQNASTGAHKLYKHLYKMSYKTNSIVTKSLAYIQKVVNYTPRYIRKLTRELEALQCLETIPRSSRNGKLCNQYALTAPEHIIQEIQSKPRKPSLAAKLKEIKQTAVYRHIDFSTEVLDSAYYATCSDVVEDTPPEQKDPSLIFSDYVRENINKGGTPLTESPPIIDEQLTEKMINDLEIFSQTHSEAPDELLEELMFSIRKRFFVGQSLSHAVNQAKKLVREGKWNTPYGIFKAYRESLPKKIKKVIEPIAPPIVYVKSPVLPGESQAEAMVRLQLWMKSEDEAIKRQASLDLLTVLRMEK